MKPTEIHDWLVRTSLQEATSQIGRGARIWSDLADPGEHPRPFKVGGYVPDYVVELPNGELRFGEAKVGKDLDSAHTYDQLAAFSDYLYVQGQGQLTLIVIFGQAGSAQSVWNVLDLRLASERRPTSLVEEWLPLTKPVCKRFYAY